MSRRAFLSSFLCWMLLRLSVDAQVYNIKVVTDANPDYHDMESMIHSMTANWPTVREKCWAIYYWNHIARRQTAPMILHGLELTDPIRRLASGMLSRICQNASRCATFWAIAPSVTNPASNALANRPSSASSGFKPAGRPTSIKTHQSG